MYAEHITHLFQDFLEGRVQYVSVAMDDHAGIAYGTRICIKELNIKYNKLIVFAVCIYYLPVVISTYNKDKQINLNDL